MKSQENNHYVFDIIRKKYVVLTPEEWVRQHLLHYFTNEGNYPASLIAIERGLEMNGLKKRFDVLVFNKSGNPILLAECKSPDVALSQETFLQAAIYNSRFNCPYLLITNGLSHFYCHYENEKTKLFEGIPKFDELQ